MQRVFDWILCICVTPPASSQMLFDYIQCDEFSPLLWFAPGTSPVACCHANHWAMMTWYVLKSKQTLNKKSPEKIFHLCHLAIETYFVHTMVVPKLLFSFHVYIHENQPPIVSYFYPFLIYDKKMLVLENWEILFSAVGSTLNRNSASCPASHHFWKAGLFCRLEQGSNTFVW